MSKVDNQISTLIKSRRVELEKTVGQAIGQIESNQDLVKMINQLVPWDLLLLYLTKDLLTFWGYLLQKK